jgi:hypothetical protein
MKVDFKDHQQRQKNHLVNNSSFSSRPMLNSINETTTNTFFNQDSQDTGYQTNSGSNCQNGSNSSNSSATSAPHHLNHIIDGTTNNNNFTSISQLLKPFSDNRSLFNSAVGDSERQRPDKLSLKYLVDLQANDAANTATSTPMSVGCEDGETEFKFGPHYDALASKNELFKFMGTKSYLDVNTEKYFGSAKNSKATSVVSPRHELPIEIKNPSSLTSKRTILGNNLKINSNVDQNGAETIKTSGAKFRLKKSSSISLNSLENIQPVGKLK